MLTCDSRAQEGKIEREEKEKKRKARASFFVSRLNCVAGLFKSHLALT